MPSKSCIRVNGRKLVTSRGSFSFRLSKNVRGPSCSNLKRVPIPKKPAAAAAAAAAAPKKKRASNTQTTTTTTTTPITSNHGAPLVVKRQRVLKSRLVRSLSAPPPPPPPPLPPLPPLPVTPPVTFSPSCSRVLDFDLEDSVDTCVSFMLLFGCPYSQL